MSEVRLLGVLYIHYFVCALRDTIFYIISFLCVNSKHTFFLYERSIKTLESSDQYSAGAYW